MRPAMAPLERPLAELALTLVAFESLVTNLFWTVVAIIILLKVCNLRAVH